MIRSCFVCLLFVAASAVAQESEEKFVRRALADVDLGAPVVAEPLILIPLLRLDAPDDIGVDAAYEHHAASWSEPEFPQRRYDLAVANGSERPVLVVGGTVVVGGKLDRLVRHDAIIPPRTTGEFEALPAAWLGDRRRTPVPFEVSDTFAPFYLRQRAQSGGLDTIVTRFVSRWMDFRNEGDERRSLAAISSSNRLATFCVACQEATRDFPKPLEGRHVVGCIVAVRGRVQAFALYGTNGLLQAHFAPLVRSAAFAAAAIELRAEEIGLPLPGGDDAERREAAVMEQARELLDGLRGALVRHGGVRDGLLGDAYLVRTTAGTRGRLIAYKGAPVHLTVFPDDPFERALYAEDVDLPPEPDGDDGNTNGDPAESLPALERKEATGRRLTEAEKRILERLRNRRNR